MASKGSLVGAPPRDHEESRYRKEMAMLKIYGTAHRDFRVIWLANEIGIPTNT